MSQPGCNHQTPTLPYRDTPSGSFFGSQVKCSECPFFDARNVVPIVGAEFGHSLSLNRTGFRAVFR